MFKYLTATLVGIAAAAFFVVIPLHNSINIDASGRPLAVKEIPPVTSTHDVFKGEWWRDREQILKVRAMYSEFTDEQFLSNYLPGSSAYANISKALNDPLTGESFCENNCSDASVESSRSNNQ